MEASAIARLGAEFLQRSNVLIPSEQGLEGGDCRVRKGTTPLRHLHSSFRTVRISSPAFYSFIGTATSTASYRKPRRRSKGVTVTTFSRLD